MDASGYALDTTWRTLLRDLGVAPADVLRRAGLPDDLFAREGVRLPPAEYYALWRGLEDELGDPLLPLRLCEAVRSESFSPPLFAALCSPDLRVAFERVGRYKQLIGPMRLSVTPAADQFAITIEWLDRTLPPPDSLVWMELLFCVTLARMGTRESIRPLAVTSTVVPTPRAAYEAFAGAPIHHGTNDAVVFSAADATRPFMTSNDALWSVFEPDLRQRLAALEAGASTASPVRAALLEGLPSGLVSMQAIARRLAVSTRTLQRRVEAEGTSFLQILERTREELARHYLRRTQLPIAEIAFLLGFDEPNSFYRAFRTWTGTTPETARRQA